MASINRVVMNRSSRKLIRNLDPGKLDVAEISGKWGQAFAFRSYTQFRYPDYDICEGPFRYANNAVRTFDLILANQVWEHLERPYAATRNVRQMLRPSGYFWVAVPFFIPFHPAPVDCSRWTARGLKNLLIEAGFEDHKIEAHQWGNRGAALKNLGESWPPIYDAETDSLENDPDMPICAWALAQR